MRTCKVFLFLAALVLLNGLVGSGIVFLLTALGNHLGLTALQTMLMTSALIMLSLLGFSFWLTGPKDNNIKE